MNKNHKIIIFSVLIGVIIIVLLYMNYLTSYDFKDAEKNNKHHTSKVTAYKFDYKDRHIIKLEDGTLFEQDNLSINDANYDVKKPYKLNYNEVKTKPQITYVKVHNKLDKETHYYILKVSR